MEEGEARLVAGVGEVRIELLEVGGADHRLVDDGRGRQRDEEEVEPGADLTQARACELLCLVEQGVERVIAAAVGRALDERVHDVRDAGARDGAEDVEVGRDVAVGDDVQAEEVERGLERLQGGAAAVLDGGEEEGADRDRSGGVAEEVERDVGHDARAVAGAAVGGARSAMLHRRERAEGELEQAVVGCAAEAGDEAHSARAVLGPHRRGIPWRRAAAERLRRQLVDR